MKIEVKNEGFYNAYSGKRAVLLRKGDVFDLIEIDNRGDYVCDSWGRLNGWNEKIYSYVVIEKENAKIFENSTCN